jgi:hypothetical protein
MKLGYEKKKLTVTQYSSMNGTKKLVMFTNTSQIIYAVAMECYKVVIIWYQQIICLQCKEDI